jgi:tRNA(Leu) C34 or U34 (ribose-2'-O)-methylase TrmL
VYIDVCSSSNLCTKSYLNMIQQYCFTGNKRMAGRSSLDHSYTTKHTVFKSFNLCTKVI